MQQQVGIREQFRETFAIFWLVKIEPGAAFTERYLRYHARFFPTGRIDAQNVRAVAGQKPTRHGTGEHSCEIQYLEAG